MRHLQALIGILILGLGVASCSSKTSEMGEMSSADGAFAQVTQIDLDESGEASKILVQADREPKYNVFKLTDPDRIMIDLIDAQLSGDLPEMLSGQNGIVQEIKVQGIQDSISTLVRLEVRLSEPANYLASVEGSSLVVRTFPLSAEDASEDLVSEDLDIAVLPPLAMEDSEFSDELPSMDDFPSLDETAESTLPSVDAEEIDALPELAAPSLDESMPSPSVEEAAPSLSEMPLEDTAPELTAPSINEMELPSVSEAPVVETPPAPVVPLPVPVPLVAEAQEEDSTEEPMASNEDNRVIVEPDPAPTNNILTQEIPSSELTEGTSLLSGIGSKVYTGRRVSLEFQDANVQDVLRLIAEVSMLNIILSDDVKGKVTLKLIDVPWDQALDILLTSNGLDKVQHGNILRVAPIESLKKEREIALANDKAAKQLEPVRLKLFNVNYASGADMSARIKNLLSERGSVDTDARTNTLIVEDIPENLSRIENLINVLDTQTPQVRIESRIVQANDTFSRSLGVQWGPTLRLDDVNEKQRGWQFPRNINVGTQPASGVGFAAPTAGALSEFAVDALPGGTGASSIGFRLGSINDIFNLDLRLSYAENEQIARIVSRPSVTVLDNRTARIIQGTKIPFLSSSSDGSNVQFQEAGIEISVTPQITNDGSVILKVATKSNEPASENVGGNPIISIREADTEMLIKSGRTAVLGGVFKVTEREGRNGVPGLMSIPVLGWLFKGEQKSNAREEMLIFITPYILTDTRDASAAPASTSQLAP